MASGIQRIAIAGAGGGAREIRWLIDDINRVALTYEFAGYVVSDPAHAGENDDHGHIVGAIDDVCDGNLAVDAVANGIGDPSARHRIGRRIAAAAVAVGMPSLVHPSVLFDAGSCSIGHGTVVCAGAILTVNVRLGTDTMINRGCNIGHESEIGSGSVVNPMVAVSGGVVIGDRTLVGTGATVLQYLRIGSDATIGAGAVVTRDVPNGTTVMGVPARPVGG